MVTSWCLALPELCRTCICFVFRDQQEKRIPGGVTIAAAGHCFFYLYLLFSGFKTSIELTNLDNVKVAGTL